MYINHDERSATISKAGQRIKELGHGSGEKAR